MVYCSARKSEQTYVNCIFIFGLDNQFIKMHTKINLKAINQNINSGYGWIIGKHSFYSF